MSVSLRIACVVTAAFNLAPIFAGYGMMMNAVFVLYAAAMCGLSLADRRILGYGTVLIACNPANALANMQFSLLLAGLTIAVEKLARQSGVKRLLYPAWWWCIFGAFVASLAFAPLLQSDVRDAVSEVKNTVSRLGYLCALPIVIQLTVRDAKDGVRLLTLLCLMVAGLFTIFFLLGATGPPNIVDGESRNETDAIRYFGAAQLNFLRTQVSFVLAVIPVAVTGLLPAAGSWLPRIALAVAGAGCTLLLVALGSIGSAAAMICGLLVLGICYYRLPGSWGQTTRRVALLAILLLGLGTAVISTENTLLARFGVKEEQLRSGEEGRMERWLQGLRHISTTPHGIGLVRDAFRPHNDFMVYFIAYGWPSGVLYVGSVLLLAGSMWRACKHAQHGLDRSYRALTLVCLGTLSTYSANAMTDLGSANIGYFVTIWTFICTSATITCVATSNYSGGVSRPASAMFKRRVPAAATGFRLRLR